MVKKKKREAHRYGGNMVIRFLSVMARDCDYIL